MHFRGSNLKTFLVEHAPRHLVSGTFGFSFTWPLAMYLHVTGEILSATPASKLNDNPDSYSLKVNAYLLT